MDSTTGDSPRTTLLLLGGGLLIGLAIGFVVFVGFPPAQGEEAPTSGGILTGPAPAPLAGAPAPDFTLNDIHGNTVTLSRLQGSPILLNFWATWCGPCRIEMPAIEAAYQQYKADGFRVLAIDADESLADVAPFVEELNLTFDVLMDPGLKVTDLYRIRAYPSSFFVDRNGTIVLVHLGLMTETQLKQNLDKILGGS